MLLNINASPRVRKRKSLGDRGIPNCPVRLHIKLYSGILLLNTSNREWENMQLKKRDV